LKDSITGKTKVKTFSDFSKKLEETSGRASAAYARAHWNMAVGVVTQAVFKDEDLAVIEKIAKDSGYDETMVDLSKEVYNKLKDALKNMRK
jgi:hypothetical protein